jgi:hypothetical protein
VLVAEHSVGGMRGHICEGVAKGEIHPNRVQSFFMSYTAVTHQCRKLESCVGEVFFIFSGGQVQSGLSQGSDPASIIMGHLYLPKDYTILLLVFINI